MHQRTTVLLGRKGWNVISLTLKQQRLLSLCLAVLLVLSPPCSLANVALRQQWPAISSITRHRIRHCDSLQWLWNTRNHCNLIKIYFEVGKMSTDYLMGKYLGHRVSTYALMGKFPGHSMYVLFAFIYHIPAQQNWVLSLINSRQGPAQVFRLTTTANGLLQLYNKIQFYDHGEWWDLRETISVRRLGRYPGTHTMCYSLSDSGIQPEENHYDV